MTIISSGSTDIGQLRETNQDAIFINSDIHFYLVADGMGGHNGGDIASQLAVQHIPERFSKNLSQDPKVALRNAIRYGNKIIYNCGQEHPELSGMGTTVVSLYFDKSWVYLANVGDSRAYLINNGKLFQLSRDHSLVQEKIYLGIYTRDDGVNDPMKNVLVRTVGYEENIDIDIFTYQVSKNDLFLLCSDGLHSKVSDSDIIHIINRNIPYPERAGRKTLKNAVKDLINQANRNGGQDNISVILSLTQ